MEATQGLQCLSEKKEISIDIQNEIYRSNVVSSRSPARCQTKETCVAFNVQHKVISSLAHGSSPQMTNTSDITSFEEAKEYIFQQTLKTAWKENKSEIEATL